MALTEIPGHEKVIAKFGACTPHDFKEVRIVQVETYYEEDRESFEKSVLLVLRGPKGAIEFRFSNVTDFKLSNIAFLGSFDVSDIRARQLERRSFYFEDYEMGEISGYAEQAHVAVCENAYV